ncbi:g5073 [Coccomyxa elongata]
MQVLQNKVEVILLKEHGCDNSDSQAVQPILAKSPKDLKAAMRMCPSLQTIQWQQTSSLTKSTSALMVSFFLHLTHLSLSCKVPYQALSVLGKSSSLQVLNLQRCHIPFNQLVAWPQLLSLSVHGCEMMHWPLCRHLSRCVCLDFCGTDLYDRDFLALIECSPNLRRLYIPGRPGEFRLNIYSHQTQCVVSEFLRRRPGLVIRSLTSPLDSSKYERLGTEPPP